MKFEAGKSLETADVTANSQPGDLLATSREVFGYPLAIENAAPVFVTLDSTPELTEPGRAAVVVESATTKLAHTDLRESVRIVQHSATDLIQRYPEILEAADKALASLHRGDAAAPLVFDRNTNEFGREWTYYTTVELRPENNAYIIRRAADSELQDIGEMQVNPDNGFKYDAVGLFPRFTAGEDKDVVAFKMAEKD